MSTSSTGFKGLSLAQPPAHAYLLEAEEEVGRQQARVMARQILCDLGGEDPDRFDQGNAPDDIRVEEEKISIDQVRALIREMALAPIGSRYKVFSLFHAGQMGPVSQNALLKSLEEPPAYVVWILLTDNRSRLLPTIQSRCRRLVPAGEASQLTSDPQVLAWLAKGLLGQGAEIFANPKDPLFDREPGPLLDQIYLLLQALLTCQLEGVGAGASSQLSPEERDLLVDLSQRVSKDRILASLAECQRVRGLLEVNVNSQLALEHLFLYMSAPVRRNV